MENNRFVHFVSLMGGIQKCLQKVKLVNATEVGLKGVHMLWLYELHTCPEGMSASELAARSMIDRSLISREITALERAGYIQYDSPKEAHNYNRKIRLTPQGERLAEQIGHAGMQIQQQVNQGVSEEELAVFYATLERLYQNFFTLTEKKFDPVLSAEADSANQSTSIDQTGGSDETISYA